VAQDRWVHARPLLDTLSVYRQARQALLGGLGLAGSNRDPLAEVSEHLVAALLDGTLATSRVQKGWDLTTSDSKTVQVRYLANPSDGWVNEHLVDFRSGGADRYALVIFENLEPKAVLVFNRGTLAAVGERLGKRHGERDVTLALTRRNYRQLLAERDAFRALGVEVAVVPVRDDR
jgi:hypothetical protein